MTKVTFADGGPLYHPRRSRIAHPGVRAAARFLMAIQTMAPYVVTVLRRDVLPDYEWKEILQRIEFTPDGPRTWRRRRVYIGILSLPHGKRRLTPGMVSMYDVAAPDNDQFRLRNIVSPGTAPQLHGWDRLYTFQHAEHHWVPATEPGIQDLKSKGWLVGSRRRKPTAEERGEIRRLVAEMQQEADRHEAEDQKRVAESCIPAIWEWARHFSLDSPRICELVLRVLPDWQEDLFAFKRGGPGIDESKWGKRVEFFADPARMPAFRKALRNYLEVQQTAEEPSEIEKASEQLAEFPRGLTWQAERILPFRLREPGWDADFEAWGVARQRFEAAFEDALEQHQQAALEHFETMGFQEAPIKLEDRHFEWLVLRQVFGWSPAQTAKRAGVTVGAVRQALDGLADLLDLKLRPARVGRPPGSRKTAKEEG